MCKVFLHNLNLGANRLFRSCVLAKSDELAHLVVTSNKFSLAPWKIRWVDPHLCWPWSENMIPRCPFVCHFKNYRKNLSTNLRFWHSSGKSIAWAQSENSVSTINKFFTYHHLFTIINNGLSCFFMGLGVQNFIVVRKMNF